MTSHGLASCPGGVEILLAASCYGNRDKLQPDEPVGSKGFTSHVYWASEIIVRATKTEITHVLAHWAIGFQTFFPTLAQSVTPSRGTSPLAITRKYPPSALPCPPPPPTHTHTHSFALTVIAHTSN